MTLEFHINQRRNNQFWEAIVFYRSADSHSEEHLNESQYQRIADWCRETFHTDRIGHKIRARRMAYDAFWFKNRADLDWFVLFWGAKYHQEV